MAQLYDLNPYLQTFEAEVVALEGQKIALSQTLFYPEGGGQNSDTGLLEWGDVKAQVVGLEKRDGAVWHTLEGIVPQVGTVLEGRMDWNRRYRHMQRHTAEHLLAQAFLRVSSDFRVQAVSMRSPECTLDFGGHPDESDALEATKVWMEAVYRNLPVRAFEVLDSDLERYPLRRAPKVSGLVRLVVVEDPSDSSGFWEVSACGGTHLARTGEAGPLLIHRLERVKSGLTRVVFSAGWEAFEQLSQTYLDARGLAQGFSSGLPQLVSRVESLREEHAGLKTLLEDSRLEVARHRVEAAPSHDWNGGVLKVLELENLELMSAVIKTLGALERTLGIVYGEGKVAVTSTMDSRAGDVLRELLERSGGKGGGRPELAQGSADPAKLKEAIERWVRSSAQVPEVRS
ncbi:MAG: serine-tRNA(Ala) deacylase [Pseudopedobacter sp.]|nr:serine-tRNA(Ala) deacylase [Deinococcales bacterium]